MNTEPIGFKGTPGKLSISYIKEEGELFITSSDVNYVIASIVSEPLEDMEQADAKLFAASKSMAIALQYGEQMIHKIYYPSEEMKEFLKLTIEALKQAGL